MKVHSIRHLCLFFCLAACTNEGVLASSANSIPEGRHWQVTLDGASPHESSTLMKQHVSGFLMLMGTGGPGNSGVILKIPMKTPYETGIFEKGVEITLPGISIRVPESVTTPERTIS